MTTTTGAGTASGQAKDWSTAPLNDLIDYLVARHHQFLRAQLPQIEDRFERILGGKDPKDVCGFVPKLAGVFQELKAELDAHLMKEEQILFPMIARMEDCKQRGEALPPFHCGSVRAPIGQMEFEHTNGKRALAPMREIAGGYRIEEGCCQGRTALFDNLTALESDLIEHIRLEEEFLHPRSIALEQDF